MSDNRLVTPTLELVADLVRQTRLLIAAELQLAKTELACCAHSAAVGATSLAAGGAIMFAGFLMLLGGVAAFFVRLGAPWDAACAAVAAAALLGGWALLRSGVRFLARGEVLPVRSIAQMSSIFGRR